MSEPAAPRHFPPMTGRTYQLGPMTLAFKPCEAEVDGVYSMIESIEPPGASVDLHRHPAWQETFLVLDGRFDFNVAGLLASQPEQAPSARQRVEIRP